MLDFPWYTSLILVLLPILVTGFTQLIKVIIGTVQRGNLRVKDYYKWGGFPSSHSALVASLATIVALIDGIYSLTFAITIAFGLLVVRDALGLREFVEQHSYAINILRKLLPKKEQNKIPQQVESVGHSLLEVWGGLLIGVLVTLVVYYFLVGQF